MKNVTNGGISAFDLERGYSDTGAIPDIGDSISGAEEKAAKYAKREREEQAMAKKYGWDEEPMRGGFMDHDEDCN